MKNKKQIRIKFKTDVFKRDNGVCVFCELPAVDAHHIVDRSLWEDGGYHLNNGASLCEEHHKQAEDSTLSCEEIRKAAGITSIILPDTLNPKNNYDKWGNNIS